MVELRLSPQDLQNFATDYYISVRVGDDEPKWSKLAETSSCKFSSAALSGRKFGKLEVFRRVGTQLVCLDPEMAEASDQLAVPLGDEKGDAQITFRTQVQKTEVVLPTAPASGSNRDQLLPDGSPSAGVDDARQAAECRVRLLQLAVVLSTILLGILVMRFSEGLLLSESLYLIVQVVTTLGYGDITVSEPWNQWFMTFYSLWLLILLAYFLNRIVKRALHSQQDSMKERLKMFECSVSKYFRPHADITEDDVVEVCGKYNRFLISFGAFAMHVLFGTLFYPWLEGCTCSYGFTFREGCTEETACTAGYTIDHLQAFYMSVITLTTIGFGDFTPRTQIGRMVGIVWILSGIASAAAFLEVMQGVLLKREEERELMEFHASLKMMDAAEFAKIDVDGDGTLSKSEFIQHCLVHQRFVDAHIVKAIGGLYERIDADRSDKVTLTELRAYQRHVHPQKDVTV